MLSSFDYIYCSFTYSDSSLLFVPKRAERTKGVTLWNFLCLFLTSEFEPYFCSILYSTVSYSFHITTTVSTSFSVAPFRIVFIITIAQCSNRQFPSLWNGQSTPWLSIPFFPSVVVNNNLLLLLLHHPQTDSSRRHRHNKFLNIGEPAWHRKITFIGYLQYLKNYPRNETAINIFTTLCCSSAGDLKDVNLVVR